jgi:hypothetical protein
MERLVKRKAGLVGTLLGGTAMFFQSLLPTPASAEEIWKQKFSLEVKGKPRQYTASVDQTENRITLKITDTTKNKKKLKDMIVSPFLLIPKNATVEGIQRDSKFEDGKERKIVPSNDSYPFTLLHNLPGEKEAEIKIIKGTPPGIGSSPGIPLDLMSKALAILEAAPLKGYIKEKTGDDVPKNYQTIALGIAKSKFPTLQSELEESVSFALKNSNSPSYLVAKIQTEDFLAEGEVIAIKIPGEKETPKLRNARYPIPKNPSDKAFVFYDIEGNKFYTLSQTIGDLNRATKDEKSSEELKGKIKKELIELKKKGLGFDIFLHRPINFVSDSTKEDYVLFYQDKRGGLFYNIIGGTKTWMYTEGKPHLVNPFKKIGKTDQGNLYEAEIIKDTSKGEYIVKCKKLDELPPNTR